VGYARPQPRRLASKLRKIRKDLNVTQQQMADLVRHKRSPVYRGHISEFEAGRREPSLLVLLRYARAAGVNVEELIDDELNLLGETQARRGTIFLFRLEQYSGCYFLTNMYRFN